MAPQLPYDVLHKIFKQIYDETGPRYVSKCALVSPLWADAARDVRFKSFKCTMMADLVDYDEQTKQFNLLRKPSELIDFLEANPKTCENIRDVHLSIRRTSKLGMYLPAEQLYRIIQRLPDLRSLKLSNVVLEPYYGIATVPFRPSLQKLEIDFSKEKYSAGCGSDGGSTLGQGLPVQASDFLTLVSLFGRIDELLLTAMDLIVGGGQLLPVHTPVAKLTIGETKQKSAVIPPPVFRCMRPHTIRSLDLGMIGAHEDTLPRNLLVKLRGLEHLELPLRLRGKYLSCTHDSLKLIRSIQSLLCWMFFHGETNSALSFSPGSI